MAKFHECDRCSKKMAQRPERTLIVRFTSYCGDLNEDDSNYEYCKNCYDIVVDAIKSKLPLKG